MSFRGHFDGQVIVLDEPAELPVDEPLEIEVRRSDGGGASADAIAGRRRRLRLYCGHLAGPELPPSAFDRETLYHESG
jgi:hypothetical protein